MIALCAWRPMMRRPAVHGASSLSVGAGGGRAVVTIRKRGAFRKSAPYPEDQT
jgi:hypothetical protein